MPSSSRIRKRLIKLHKRDPHCYYCGNPTNIIDIDKKNLHDPNFLVTLATLEHINTRWDVDKRWTPNPERKERTVLACWKCNQERGAIRQAQVPEFIRKLKTGGGGILDALPENNSIKETLSILKEHASLYRTNSFVYISKLLDDLKNYNDEDECLIVIKEKIKYNLLIIKDSKTHHLKEETYFLFQFIPKYDDRQKIREFIAENYNKLYHEKIGNFIGNVISSFKQQIVNIDGNVVREVVMEIQNAS